MGDSAEVRLPQLIRICSLLVTFVILATSCASAELVMDPDFVEPTPVLPITPVAVPVLAAGEAREFPPAPEVPDGPLAPEVAEILDRVFGSGTFDDLRMLSDTDDARVAWILTDLMRFIRPGEALQVVQRVWSDLTGVELDAFSPWNDATNHMIAWDTPEPPGYAEFKRRIFVLTEPAWGDFFDDPNADIDWRHVSWGGVLIDDRPLADTIRPCPESCIPAINDPAVTDAAGGAWYPDDALVFGLEVNGESRAYPKNLMEVHEMTNDTLGGRRIGMPYCTLCGSAQAYYTDDVSGAGNAGIEIPNDAYELRTSGLLIRSNKVMYEFHTRSVFDTFTGRAVTGPLHDAGVQLEELTVVTTTWADWKAQHPDTTILAENRPWGGTYNIDPLRGRDDNGPIFPIGDVDPRLSVQEPVVGVIAPDGTPLAFPVSVARATLQNRDPVEMAGVELRLDGSGVRAQLPNGDPIASHHSFWFAWSQFHPDTLIWE